MLLIRRNAFIRNAGFFQNNPESKVVINSVISHTYEWVNFIRSEKCGFDRMIDPWIWLLQLLPIDDSNRFHSLLRWTWHANITWPRWESTLSKVNLRRKSINIYFDSLLFVVAYWRNEAVCLVPISRTVILVLPLPHCNSLEYWGSLRCNVWGINI